MPKSYASTVHSTRSIASIAIAAALAMSFLANRAEAQNLKLFSGDSEAEDRGLLVGPPDSATLPGMEPTPVLLTRPVSEPSPEIVANPGRPALATSALLTPQGYVQVENGVLFASGSAEFATRVAQEETMRFTVAPRLQFIVAAEPVAFSEFPNQESTHEGDVTGGFQAVLKPSQGWRPTVAVGYLRLLRGGEASGLDIGGFKNSALLQASADFGHWHVDSNLFANEQAQNAVRRAQWGQAVAVSHPVNQKLGLTGEVRHFTEPFNPGPAWGLMAAAAYSVHPNLVLDLGIVRGLTSDSTRWQIASGVTYVLPRGVWGLTGKQ
jgi:hypothetical protein